MKIKRTCQHCRYRGQHDVIGAQPGTRPPLVSSPSPHLKYEEGSESQNPRRVAKCPNCCESFNVRVTRNEMLFGKSI